MMYFQILSTHFGAILLQIFVAIVQTLSWIITVNKILKESSNIIDFFF